MATLNDRVVQGLHRRFGICACCGRGKEGSNILPSSLPTQAVLEVVESSLSDAQEMVDNVFHPVYGSGIAVDRYEELMNENVRLRYQTELLVEELDALSWASDGE